MRKAALVLVLTVGVALGFGTAAIASGNSNDPAAVGSTVGEAAVPRAQAPNVRMAALLLADGTLAFKKGVASVTVPTPGEYCITPQPALGIDVTRSMPQVSIDWSNSFGDASSVQVRSTGFGCPAGAFDVMTFSGEDGSFDLTAEAFYITVP